MTERSGDRESDNTWKSPAAWVDDTIVAVASPPGGAARGVIRISGPHAIHAVAQITESTPGPFESQALRSRSIRGSVVIPELGAIPASFYVWPLDRSYTRQPTVEIHTLGSPVLLHAITEHLCRHGTRLARAGEFTLRAFLAGRLDLTQAEAVLGVIHAEDQDSLHRSLMQLAGGVSQPLQLLRSQLIDLRADLEAGLDFVDEDITFISSDDLVSRLADARDTLQTIRNQVRSRGTHSELPQVVLWGLPNSGKSSLLNAITQRSVSLVSPVAGTTRDYVTYQVEWDNVRFELVDTAGIEELTSNTSNPSDTFERQKTPQRHTMDSTPQSDAQHLTQWILRRSIVRVLCLDKSRPLTPWEKRQLQESAGRPNWMVVHTKGDLADPHAPSVAQRTTSSHTGEGIELFLTELAQQLRVTVRGDLGMAAITARCGQAMEGATESMERAYHLAKQGSGEELVAAELRVTLDHLADVVGAVYTNDLLDRIFSRFCIGK